MGLIRDIQQLEPATRDMVEKGIAILRAQGIRFWVNETLRTKATQEAYYAQGRKTIEQVNALRKTAGLWPLGAKENEKSVTQTLNSRHILGQAIDIVPADKDGGPWWGAPQSEYLKIAAVMKSVGLEWGGDWKGGWDQPHYQSKVV